MGPNLIVRHSTLLFIGLLFFQIGAAQAYDAYALVTTEASANYPTAVKVRTGYKTSPPYPEGDTGECVPSGCTNRGEGSTAGSVDIKFDIYLAKFDSYTNATLCAKKLYSGAYSATLNLDLSPDAQVGSLNISETYLNWPFVGGTDGYYSHSRALAIAVALNQPSTISAPNRVFPYSIAKVNGNISLTYSATWELADCSPGTCTFRWWVPTYGPYYGAPISINDLTVSEAVPLDPVIAKQQLTKPVGKLRSLGSTPQPPSVFTSNVTKASTQDYELSVLDECDVTSTPIPNANVTLNYSAVPFSGGHAHHDANRDRHAGLFESTATTLTSEPTSTSPFQVATGTTGRSIVKYVAPQASGQTKATLTCTLPDGKTCEPRDEIIGVGVNGLLSMGGGGNYIIDDKPETHAMHPESHFVTPLLQQRLLDLAGKYATKFPGHIIGYNDMSLQYGGLLDYMAAYSNTNAWKPPHKAHRWGSNADIPFRLIGRERLLEARRLIRAACLKPEEHPADKPNHFHVSPISCPTGV